MKKTTSGFTIVELIIVVVVIAILATISIVAYNGIQSRGYDAAIQSDLSNFAKKIQLEAADTDAFLPGGATTAVGGTITGNSVNFPGFTFSPSKESYLTTASNLYYCTGVETSSGQRIFRITARSKSGNLFSRNSNASTLNTGNAAMTYAFACQGISEPYTWSYGHNASWHAWAT